MSVLVALALTGCGSGGATPAASPSEPPPTYTSDQLKAALPGVDDVPTGSKKVYSCPGAKDCESGPVSVTIDMLPPISATDNERVASKSNIDDFAYVRALTVADEAAAAAKVEQDRAGAQKYVGDYVIKPEQETKDRFVPGERGTGSVDNITVADWDGIAVAHTGVWLAPDQFGTFDNEGKVETVDLTLARGLSVLTVKITVKADYRKAGAAKRIARQVAEEYIARLG